MSALYDSVRRRWRRLKAAEPWNGSAAARASYAVLRACARLVKRCGAGTDLAARALYLYYHPELGLAPMDAWQDRVHRRVPAAELAALKARLADARAQTCRALGVTEGPLDDVRPLDGAPDGDVAVHLHVFYPELLPAFAAAFARLPFPFDLYVSVPDGVAADEASVRAALAGVPCLRQLVVRRCPNRGRDIAPLACLFGRALARYRYIGHFHTKRSPHDARGRGWLDFILGRLAGSADGCRRIFALLSGDCGLISAADFVEMPEDPSGWGRNLAPARDLVRRAGLTVDLAARFPVIVFPQGSMFWARTDFLRRFLDLPLSFDDFPAEPVGVDGTLAHAGERLFYVWGLGTGLRVRRIP